MARHRFQLLLAVVLLAIINATCGDGRAPLEPVVPATGSFEIDAPTSVYAEQPFTVTVMAVATDGTRPDPAFNGSVSLSTSAGTVAPGSLTLVNGVGTGDVTLSGHAGAVSLVASAGGATGTAVVSVVGTDAVARIELSPSAFLLTEAGQTRQLEARAYDVQGRPTQANIVWQSSADATISINADGMATAVAGLGSAQVTATAGGISSAPVLGLLARPAGGVASVSLDPAGDAAIAANTTGGAILVDDDQIIGDLVAVDPGAEYEPGWQYQARLRGVTPEVGQLVLASGEAPVGGRTVAVQVTGDEALVTLELLRMEEMFDALVIDETLSLEHAEMTLTDEAALMYAMARLPDGTLRLLPRGLVPVRDAQLAQALEEFDAGPFKCKAEVIGAPIQFRTVPVMTFRPSLDFALDYDREQGGLQKLALMGQLTTTLKADPRFTVRATQKFQCQAELAQITLPIGGPLALIFGGHVPLGIGFEFEAATTALDFGVKLSMDVTAQLEAGLDCTSGDCEIYGKEPTATHDWSIEPELPDLADLAEQFTSKIRLFPHAYDKLSLGNRFIKQLRFDVVEARIGLAQFFNLSTPRVQASDPDYASDVRTSVFGQLKLGDGLDKWIKKLTRGVASVRFELRHESPLFESPAGTLTIEPATVRSGNQSQAGELATFTVHFDRVLYGGGYAVEEVQIRRLQDGALVNAPPPCATLQPQSSGQRTFTCTGHLLEEHIGEQTFYAFAKTSLFGLFPVPIPLEIAKDSKATVTVLPPADDGDIDMGEGDGRGSSWGDPHLITPDGRVYDFMAVGDYLLVGSTDPGDDFEVQVRYRQPDGDEDFSWNEAVAMNVLGDIVEVYAKEWGRREIVVNGDAFEARNGMHVRLGGGGAISVENWEISVSWPDRSLVHVKPTSIERVLASVDVHLPEERRGRVEGLLGNFDGNPANDLRIRNGAILQDPSTSDLYLDFRQSWRIAFGTAESLFSQGSEQFDPRFPFSVVSVADLDPEDREWGRDACQAAGVLDPEIMNACIVDVVLTGDTDWAYVAAGVDPRVLGVMVSPKVGYVQLGDSRQFGAIVTGTTNRQVTWTVTGGTFTEDSPNVMTYMAPAEPGVYTITATLVADPSHTSLATVYVSEVPTGYSKQWAGVVDDFWSTAANWIPVGVPDSTDNVYIPTGTVHDIRIMPTNLVVNDLWIEPGAVIAGALRVWGNADVHAPSLWLYMLGHDRTVRGTVRFLDIQGSIVAAGPVVAVDQISLTGGTFRPARNRVEVGGFVAPLQTGGRLVMTHADDHVVVDGSFQVGSSGMSDGSLTAGILEVRGNVGIGSGPTIFEPSGSHRLVLNGSTEQSLTIGLGRTRLHHVEFANPAGVRGGGTIHIHGTATISAGRFLVADPFNPVYLHGHLADAVGGGWQVTRTQISNPAPQLPERMVGALWFGSWGHQITVNVALQNHLEIDGDLVVELESFLRLNGHTLRVNGNVAARYHGSMVMADDADHLIVSGNAAFGDALFDSNAGALFSAGVFEIAGNLFDNRNQYKASGSHRTVLNGTDPQTVSLYCYFTNCFTFGATATTGLHDVDIRNPAGVTFVGRGPGVTGTFLVEEDAAVNFETFGRLAGSMDLRGALTLPQDRRIAVADTLFLRNAATLNNHGQMDVGACEKEDGHTINGTDPCP